MKKIIPQILCLSFFALIKTNNCNAQFTIYNTSNSALGDNYCWYVNQNSLGDVWVSTVSSGAYKLSGSTWSNYNMSNSNIGSNYITPIAFETNNDTWIGSYSSTGGVSKYSSGLWTNFNTGNSGLPHDNVLAIVIDKQNNKWFGTRNGGLAKYNGSTWTVYNTSNSGIPGDIIYALEVDTIGNIWVGTALTGLGKFDGTNWTTYNTGNSSIQNNDIYGLKYNKKTNSLWIGTNGGVSVLKNNTWTSYNSTNTPNFSGNNFRGITHSYLTGNTYISGYTGGIEVFDGFSWKNYNTSNSNLPSNCIFSMNVGINGQVWASTYGGGIVNFTDIFSSVKENTDIIKQVSTYPNPSKNQINFSINTIKSGKGKLIIYDVQGKFVKEIELNFDNNKIEDNTSVELESLNSGLYYYSILFEGEQKSGRFLIE